MLYIDGASGGYGKFAEKSTKNSKPTCKIQKMVYSMSSYQ